MPRDNRDYLKTELTRTESIVIKCRAFKKHVKLFRPHFNDSLPPDTNIIEGDYLDLTYRFYIDYFGQCVARFQSLINAMDAGAITTVDVNELTHGKCLVQELFVKIQELQDKINGGSAAQINNQEAK